MAYDAFAAGVEPGGLRTQNEIRILICYLLSSVGAPLSKEDILRIMQDNGLANYFEIIDAVSELLENGNITSDGEEPPLLTAGGQARMIAKQLETAVPISVRERAVGAALCLLARAKRERENHVEIEKTENGCEVTCHISDGSMDMMRIALYVPDDFQAAMVKENFHRSPETVYQALLALLTGDQEMMKSAVTDWQKTMEQEVKGQDAPETE